MSALDTLDRIAGDTLLEGPVMLAMALVVLISLAVAFRPRWRDRLAARLESLHTYGNTDISLLAQDAVVEEEAAGYSKRLSTTLVRILGPLPLIGKKEQAKIEKHLARAGIRAHHGVPLFMFAKLTSAVLLGLLGLAFAFANPAFELPVAAIILATAASAVVGGLVPETVLKRIGFARRKRIAKALPDAMDLLVICAEAGLSLDVAIDRVAREMRMAAPDLSNELDITVAELQLLSDRKQALDNLAYRTDLESLRGVVTTLTQGQKYGTPLSQSLRVLGKEMRTARALAVEERAARLPAMISVPLIVFILPAIFVVVGGPAILEVTRVFRSL